MYGKHFASMYEGSMIGAGAHVFAVMGYVIANYRLDDDVGAQVRLNPKLLAMVLGEPQERIQEAIDYLCAPDPKSTTKAKEGRRLVRLGEFDFQVVNGAKYTSMQDEQRRRQLNRVRVARYRARNPMKRQVKKGPGGNENRQVREYEQGQRTAEELGA